ncbi:MULTISPECIES: hypothetical protein [unclassified Providencia]|uniref:hypothetical protein n=1 Tax=unclassified Providencia TaxID=2633465 RepID=UPI00234C0100|nr:MULTISPECIES: hypothetical protein [unclassified Providencia]
MSISKPTEAVNRIGGLNLSGNVIPSSWWQHIKLPSGKPDSTAIVLLSDIVYWYRPSEVRDEQTGELLGWRKRFHGDKLQRSYQSFADQFGFSKREATDALKRLRKAGLITLELRTVVTTGGVTLNNVLFVEVVPDAICNITNSNFTSENKGTKSGAPITFERNSPHVETEEGLHPDVSDPTPKSDTYTEITTEITQENKTLSSQNSSESSDQPKIDFLNRYPEAVIYSANFKKWGTQKDLECAQWLFERKQWLFQERGIGEPDKPNFTEWANTIRLMREVDKRSHKEICQLYKRITLDDFWHKAVLCPFKLREQWEKVTIQLASGQKVRVDPVERDSAYTRIIGSRLAPKNRIEEISAELAGKQGVRNMSDFVGRKAWVGIWQQAAEQAAQEMTV